LISVNGHEVPVSSPGPGGVRREKISLFIELERYPEAMV
jgi:hypothetical protein